MRALASSLVLAVLFTFAGCSSEPRPAAPIEPLPAVEAPPANALDALAWYQGAEETRRLAQSVFAAAGNALDRALADPGWSAIGQGADAASLPPAVITDIDETLLDNSAFQARLLLDGKRFDEAKFNAWAEAAEAVALPGALAFVRRAKELGVTVFYLSNRGVELESATRRNLEREGFDVDGQVDRVLSQGERPEWGSNKESRRREVARSYRVLLLLGDDLNDFLDGARGANLERRHELAEAAGTRWGTSWFVLPNPLYGSWEGALLGAPPGSLSPGEVSSRKRSHLRPFRGELPPP